jgi:hypothetical protein
VLKALVVEATTRALGGAERFLALLRLPAPLLQVILCKLLPTVCRRLRLLLVGALDGGGACAYLGAGPYWSLHGGSPSGPSPPGPAGTNPGIALPRSAPAGQVTVLADWSR